MRLIDGITGRVIRWRYSRIARYLSTADPRKIAAAGERRVLKAFDRAADKIPAYQKILRQQGVDPREITSIEAFRSRVPVIDKETIFSGNELRDLCVDGNLDDIRLFYSSSGHSGTFSFGAETAANAKDSALGVEFALQNTFGALDRKTLLINCLPMGVKIHTRTLPLAETSVRQDVILSLIAKLKDDFDQFVLIGEHLFIKKVIEQGAEAGIEWKDIVVHVVTGAEYIAENFRSYLASLLGIDFESPRMGMIGVNFGLSELSMSIFAENIHTIRIRRLAHVDHEFRRALYGRNMTFCPNIMQYFPHQTFIETIPGPNGRSELIVSMLDHDLKIPLIRYNTGDIVETMGYDDLAGILQDASQESLLPAFHLPVGIIQGKLKPLVLSNGSKVYSEQVKEAIYADFSVASKITGNFKLKQEDGAAVLMLQLRAGIEPRQELIDALAKQLKTCIETEVRIQMLPYEQFPYGFEPDFERKNRYV